MLHWTPGRTSTVTPIAALVPTAMAGRGGVGAARSDHARMLAHAASRRRAAVGAERDYWKACAPAAVARAAAIRKGSGFARLP